jgi:hypothetical protein
MAIDLSSLSGGLDEEKNVPTNTYAIDWASGRIVGMMDGQEAVRQFIHKAILTPRFRCLIYDNQYGSEIDDVVIRQNASRSYIEAELPFLVKDALIYDDRITDVYNIVITFGDSPEQDSITVSFDVDTIFGKIAAKEVI